MSAVFNFPASFKAPRGHSRFTQGEVEALFDEGLQHHLAGRIDAAVARYKRALFLKPDYADAHNNLGVALAAQGRMDDAMARYRRALALKPDFADAHGNLGVALAAQGRNADAISHYERVLVLNPDHPGAHYNLAIALAAQGRIAEAVTHYRCALALNPQDADAHNNLGNALDGLGDPDAAMTHYTRALAINPDHAEAHNNLGNIFREQGRFDAAMAHYDRAIAIEPASAEAHFHRAEIKIFHQGDTDLRVLEALAGRDNLPEGKTPYVHFALAKALEDSGDYNRAFAHLRKGNDLKRAQIHYDEQRVARAFDRIAALFDRRLLDRLRGEGDPSSMPILVLGMPRSGSTLIEQILASHPQVHGAGELPNLENAAGQFPNNVPTLDGPALRRIAQTYIAGLPALADGKVRIVDKLPGNFFYVGLIRLILPNARIIHTVRNPIDTCVSCYSRLFTCGQHFSYDLAELGRYYRRYANLMAHWRSILPPGAMLDVCYENVVEDLETQARRLIAYCGLPWDDRCLSFHKTVRPVRTASAVQVRSPLFRSSIDRWRRYEAGLGPLLRELGDVAAPSAAENFHHVRAANAG